MQIFLNNFIRMTSFFYDCFNHCDCPLTIFDIWDYRVENMNVHDYDLIMLAGGHVPTQKKYFDEIPTCA